MTLPRYRPPAAGGEKNAAPAAVVCENDLRVVCSSVFSSQVRQMSLIIMRPIVRRGTSARFAFDGHPLRRESFRNPRSRRSCSDFQVGMVQKIEGFPPELQAYVPQRGERPSSTRSLTHDCRGHQWCFGRCFQSIRAGLTSACVLNHWSMLLRDGGRFTSPITFGLVVKVLALVIACWRWVRARL